MLRLQTCAIHEQALQAFGALEKRLQRRAGDFVAVINRQALKLNAVGAERVDVRVIDEVYSVQVDDAEVWRRRFQFMNVDDFLKFVLGWLKWKVQQVELGFNFGHLRLTKFLDDSKGFFRINEDGRQPEKLNLIT